MTFLGKKKYMTKLWQMSKVKSQNEGEGCQINKKMYAKGGCSKWVNGKYFGFEETFFHKCG